MTGRASWSNSESASLSASIALRGRAPARTPGWDFQSRNGSWRSIAAASPWAMPTVVAQRFLSTSLSYALLKRGRHARGMFDISPDHLIGLYAGLVALPLALISLKLRRSHAVPGTVLGASVLMAMSAAIHLGLVLTHL